MFECFSGMNQSPYKMVFVPTNLEYLPDGGAAKMVDVEMPGVGASAGADGDPRALLLHTEGWVGRNLVVRYSEKDSWVIKDWV